MERGGGWDCHDDQRREELHARESKLALAACACVCAYVNCTIHSLKKQLFLENLQMVEGLTCK